MTDQTAADAFWQLGRAGNWGTKQTGIPRLAITPSAWSFPIYQEADAGPDYIVLYPSASGGNDAPIWQPSRWESVPRPWPVKLPWRASWRPGIGTDNGAIVEMRDGTSWEIQNLRRANWFDQLALFLAGHGWSPWAVWVCDQLHRRTDSCRTKETHLVRGAGRFAKGYGLLLADEVASGEIDHPLAMVGYNVQHGPGATAVNGARVEHEGTQRVYTGLPAGDDPRCVPHGTIFQSTRSDASIEQWAFERHRDPVKRRTARIVARCLRDHGMQQLETGDGDPQIESEGRLNPKVAAVWASLGLKSDADFVDLLDGFWTRETMRVG